MLPVLFRGQLESRFWQWSFLTRLFHSAIRGLLPAAVGLALTSSSRADEQSLTLWYSKPAEYSNRGELAASVSIQWEKAGLAGKQKLTDLWLHKNIGSFADDFTTSVPSHGVVFVKAIQQ